MIIFAIESSHDDTSFAIMENNSPIWMKTISQIEIHKKYGGTVPEIASRLHSLNIGKLIEELKSKIDLFKIDVIAYTKGPGLIGSLHVGYVIANSLALYLKKPILPLNHLDGHFMSAFIGKEVIFPSLALIVSGGHSQIVYYKSVDDSKIVGETQDDAVGEAYDKVARKLGLGFPGGSLIDKIWITNNKKYTNIMTIPKTEGELDLSFSGIKTQITNEVNSFEMAKKAIDKKQLVIEFQNTIIKYLKNKMELAIAKYKPKSIVLCGGVSANKGIRKMFEQLHENAFIPDMEYTTDNAMMIARLAYEKIKK
ncbi:tRNA (adenosine(37)-N6)-threonylcarbamoyltransferase complex transferase subunit TsaD [Metamycoplasma hyosynoviae]|uniref:tRNA (adenosine(37)-N6)-threonylcarbamoyltransferase complex transferase subunit TsaD n=1 Tax=Metamycoplasma hyosynoviae TaxID=29559 RepID=UPI00235A174C|nr:tRNA (adenosine(37)-N6)-threonylcarbamoyltransferase complex transferase subunit TsaD [Metamycoplasma hyosynoviae]MDC8922079.1 tRNA (adenosine(37)-N6)-threonylcarbamoyltransferase complex transferase subunit TsaD [Metamycoplasma hyosynoviae]MDD1366031.1 tRNA (adenosine(37)-N6)-threonylcarbamoyltransferase complex transferase subunit TsaD [Metamycoplasma hyosynoviae]MDD1378070.1 tRNA (adenosine(37)-N6)-threonylcarbamoyltransferase complex transferase subunit TsaD [Metamycoplasma hyosynoviae]M